MKTCSLLVAAALSAGLLSGLVAVRPVSAAPTPATPPTLSPMAQARRDVNDAQVELDKAKKALAVARTKVEATVKTTNPQFAAVQAAFDKATADIKAATGPAMEAAHNTAAYKAALASEKSAKDRLAELNADPKSDPNAIAAAAAEITKAVTAKKKIDADAIDNDVKIADAKQRLIDNRKQLEEMKSQVDEAAKTDTDYQAADQAVTAAQDKVTQALAALDAARKAVADSRKTAVSGSKK